VESALNDALLKGLMGDPMQAERAVTRLYDVLAATDFVGFRAHLDSLFAAIPYQWHIGNPIARYEGYYASVFYSHLAALGLDLTAEDASRQGRVDLSLKFNGRIWLFEFKVVEMEPAGRALQQLKDRGYADEYRAAGQPIHLIGIEFSREQRGVVGSVPSELSARLWNSPAATAVTPARTRTGSHRFVVVPSPNSPC